MTRAERASEIKTSQKGAPQGARPALDKSETQQKPYVFKDFASI